MILYRQTMANPAFLESIQKVSQLPAPSRKAAMGDYWPVIGYCRRSFSGRWRRLHQSSGERPVTAVCP
jgi:hypothetical protein